MSKATDNTINDMFTDAIDTDAIDALTDAEATKLLRILEKINEPTPLPPGTCECGSPMPCTR